MSTKTKQCLRCKKTQSLTEFHKDPMKSDGLRIYCKKCVRSYQKEYAERRKTNGKPVSMVSSNGDSGFVMSETFFDSKEKTDISFLGKIHKVSKKNWSYPEVMNLVMGVKKQAERGMLNMNDIQAKYIPNKTVNGCISMLAELKKASIKGMSLEDYLKAGRPFRAGAKVVVAATKKEKK